MIPYAEMTRIVSRIFAGSQAPAWEPKSLWKLELPGWCSQAGAWERANPKKPAENFYGRFALLGLVFWFTTLPCFAANGIFTSGSNGSDGALNLTTAGIIDFDPKALGLDKDGDNVFHFTTINIAQGVTVRMTAMHFDGPVYWLATGDVNIAGVIDVSGEDGLIFQSALERRYSIPGPGGYPGALPSSPDGKFYSGLGPGGGEAYKGCSGPNPMSGGGAGFAKLGEDSTYGQDGIKPKGGSVYGNTMLVPLLGGSGGGGSLGGGGAGGGVILIASSSRISLMGAIESKGGSSSKSTTCCSGFCGSTYGGGGSGGSIHLLAPRIMGAGKIEVTGGGNDSNGSKGSAGRIRVEAYDLAFTGSYNPTPSRGSPYKVFTDRSIVKVATVDGVAVPTTPNGSFQFPDVTITNSQPVTVGIVAHNIPVGTLVKLYVVSENGGDQVIDSTPLAGTLDNSTASASVTLPPGFSRGFVDAKWTP